MSSARNNTTVLTVSLDEKLQSDLKDNLILQGYRALQARSPNEALSQLDREDIHIMFLDIEKFQAQELDLVHYTKMRSASTEIVILTGIGQLEEARAALRNGASFYLVKPIPFGDIKSLLDKLTLRVDQQQEHVELEQQILSDLMAGNQAMNKVLKLAMKIAPTSSTVLVAGESGTGKEFFARIIHRMSKRYEGRFVAMNCGAVPDALFESEFFGHRKGSFTGADRDKPGLVEEAHLGTLFLDEIGELSPSAQVKLLRFLQERTFRPLGETALRTVNVRIIAATNKDLFRRVKEGSFREDLFYRLNVFYLYLPPLRQRRETIPALVRLFVHRYNNLLEKHVTNLSKGAEVALANYDYPGNVRELENIIEHAIVLADGNEITEKDLPEFMFRNQLLLAPPRDEETGEGMPTLADVEKHHIERALQFYEYNYSETAKALGISRSTLWRKIKGYGLSTPAETKKG